jgi:hypothetical protein
MMEVGTMAVESLASSVGRLGGLRALRDRLAVELDECDSKRDVAALSQRFMDVLAQIEACEKAAPVQEGTALDEVNARRAAKAAKVPGRAARG